MADERQFFTLRMCPTCGRTTEATYWKWAQFHREPVPRCCGGTMVNYATVSYELDQRCEPIKDSRREEEEVII